MKQQEKLRLCVGKTIRQVIEGYPDRMIVFTDDTFCFLHPARDYDESIIDEPPYFSGLPGWCIPTDQVISAGVMSEAEDNRMREARHAESAVRQERNEREQLARLQAKYK